MTRNTRWASRLMAVAVLVTVAFNQTLVAKKGGNKPPSDPPPAGTVYFDIRDYPDRSMFGINTDGSALFPALPTTNENELTVSSPSKRLHNGDRIWLAIVDLAYPTTPVQNELFAFRLNANAFEIESVQITNLNRAIRLDFDGVIWGNTIDDQDAFISFVGVSEQFGLQRCLHRLWVSGDELALAFEFPELWTPLTASDVETVLCDDGLDTYHDWSPTGAQVAFKSDGTLYVWDTLSETSSLLAESGHQPKWSPDGTRIAFSSAVTLDHGLKPGIITINPDGTDPRLVIEHGRTTRYNSPHWAPEGTHLAIQVLDRQVKGFTQQQFSDIAVIKTDGTGLNVLTESLDPTPAKRLRGWR